MIKQQYSKNEIIAENLNVSDLHGHFKNLNSNSNEDNDDKNNNDDTADNKTGSDNNNNDNTDTSSCSDNDDNDNNEEQFLDEDLDKEIILGELRIAVFQQKYKKRWTRSNMRRNI